MLVYGVVALIVKMDDVGLSLTREARGLAADRPRPGARDAASCSPSSPWSAPLAMLWVGGHILLVSLYEIGWHDGLLEGTGFDDVLHSPYECSTSGGRRPRRLGGPIGGLVGWLLNTLVSAVVGLVVGAIVLVVLQRPRDRRRTRCRGSARGAGQAKRPPRIPRIPEARPTLVESAWEIPTRRRCATQTTSTTPGDNDGLQGR